MSESLPNWDLPSRYTLIRRIGRGTYGQVCLAQDNATNELVAIKNIKGLFEDLLDAKRLLREISILRHLDHPNIIKIKDVVIPQNEVDGTFNTVFIVMESAHTDLKKLIRSPTYLDHDQVRFLLYQAVVGLRYIHSANIMHRDIKPANILINEDCSLKICDFGLSRSYYRMNQDMKRAKESLQQSGHRYEDVKVSGDGTVEMRALPRDAEGNKQVQKPKRELTGHVVTRWYRAPEVILLEKEYSSELDVWSLGCVYAEMLSLMRENAPLYVERGPLFPGKSCFPLSPDVSTSVRRAGYPSSEDDQINAIFDVIGTPVPEDIEFISDPKALNYVKGFPSKDPKDMTIYFPGSTPEELDILFRMLVFNPRKRVNLDQLLALPYFDSVRDQEREFIADSGVDYVWDNNHDLTTEQLREIFREEIMSNFA